MYSCILLPPITKVLVVKESIFATKCMVLFSNVNCMVVSCALPFDYHERIRLKVGFTGKTDTGHQGGATESSWGEGIARASQEYAAME